MSFEDLEMRFYKSLNKLARPSLTNLEAEKCSLKMGKLASNVISFVPEERDYVLFF